MALYKRAVVILGVEQSAERQERVMAVVQVMNGTIKGVRKILPRATTIGTVQTMWHGG